MPMRVIGTAGHVDHGKSTLVKRLTGIDPDRLAEEKAREMTIDLGFAWLTLTDDLQVGLVDVPGHRDFIENMLAGVGGVDAVLLVIAADEGVMPQTREHLAILDLLGIQHGLIVLTKADLVPDAEWLDLMAADVREAVRGTTLADADILPVSAHTGAGIPELLERLTALLTALPPRMDTGAARLPIDRVFTMSGFGVVVTGTLLGGSLHVGDDVVLQPNGLRGRIRGLQSYKRAVETAQPGSRVAVNLAGVERSDLVRGMVLTPPLGVQPTLLVDVRFRHLPTTERPLRHNTEVKVFSGAAEVTAHVRLLADEVLESGAESWVQLRLDAPLALARGDRFIVRRPSPGETIGGGVVMDPHPAGRWKRFRADVLERLDMLLMGTPGERLAQASATVEPIKRAVLQKQTGFTNPEFDAALNEALTQGLLLALPDGTLWAMRSWRALIGRMREELHSFHAAYPLRQGMPREALRSRLGIKNALLTTLLDLSRDDFAAEASTVRLASHAIRFNESQQTQIGALMAALHSYTPPSTHEAIDLVGEDVLNALIDLDQVVQVQPDVIFSRAIYDELVRGVFEMIDREGNITAAMLRDRFGTTRKYAIGLLEYLDALGMTRRQGDARVRGPRAG